MRRIAWCAVVAVVAVLMSPMPATASTCGGWTVEGRGLQGGATDIEVVSRGDAWLVGWRGYDHYGSMSYRWDGSAWREVVVPAPSGPSGRAWILMEASAVGHDEVWSVGYRRAFPRSYPAHPIAARWDGRSWRWVPAGLDGVHGRLLGSAIHPRSGHPWAVGYLEGGFGRRIHTLVVRWDGQAWHRVASPGFPGTESWFSDVVAVGGTMWAVGGVGNRALLSRWDGHRWTVVKRSFDPLEAVDGVGPGRLVAVGSQVIAVNDGDGWRLARHFDRPAGLGDVVMASTSDAWAAGGVWRAVTHPTLVRRQGGPWHRVAAPVTSSDLDAIAGGPDGLWLAAGRVTDPGGFDYVTRVFRRC